MTLAIDDVETLESVLERIRDAPLQAFLAHLNGLPGTVTRLDNPSLRRTGPPARSESLRLTWSLGEAGRLQLGAACIPWRDVRSWRSWLRCDGLELIGIGIDVEALADVWRVEVDVPDILRTVTAIAAA